MIDVSNNQLLIIKAILKKHFPTCEVRAFGSRVNGKSKPYSDLDLVVIGLEKIDLKKMFQAEEAFEESVLPFRIDLLDWYAITNSFRKIIEQNCEVLQEGAPEQVSGYQGVRGTGHGTCPRVPL